MSEVKVDKIVSCYIRCATPNTPKYFTQFNIYKNFPLPCKNIKNSDIETTTVRLKINSAKIVDTIEGVSIEGQHLTGKKLIIIGEFITKTIICCPCKEKKLCSLVNNIPFSIFIIIPNEICTDEPINLKYHIEDITTTVISKNKVFISITALIQYVDEY